MFVAQTCLGPIWAYVWPIWGQVASIVGLATTLWGPVRAHSETIIGPSPKKSRLLRWPSLHGNLNVHSFELANLKTWNAELS